MAPTSDDPKLKHAGELFPIASVSAPGRPEYRIALGLTSAARGLLASFNPTLVHIATPDVLGFQAQAWAREARVPVVCSYHTHFAQVGKTCPAPPRSYLYRRRLCVRVLLF